MDGIKVFTSPDSVCYTFVFFSVISVLIGYVINDPKIAIEERVLLLVGFFVLVITLLLICKLISRISIAIDRFFDKWK